MDDDLDDIIDILNKNTDKPPLPKPKEVISIKEDKTPPQQLLVRKYDSNMDATCHSGGDVFNSGQIVEESKESTSKKNNRRRSAAHVQNSGSKVQDQGPT